MVSRKLPVVLLAAVVGVVALLVWLLPRDEAGLGPLATLPTQPTSVDAPLPSPPEPRPPAPIDAVQPADGERLAVPAPMGGGRGPREAVAVRVLDMNGHGVPGALVRAWTRDVEHPFASELREGRDAYLARFASGDDATSAALWSVFTHADPTWGESDRSAETDASGSCTLMLPRGRATLLATRGQQSSGPWSDDPWQAAPLVLALRPISRLDVQVVDALDRPLEGAVVYVWTREIFGRAVRQPRPARTDHEGRSSFELDAPVEVQVCAQLGTEWSSRHAASLHAPVEGPLIVRVGTPCAIEGSVLDPQGRPAPAATVLARGPSGEIESTRSSDDGRFHLPVGELGVWTIGANRDDWLPERSVAAEVAHIDDTVTVELRLAAPGHVTGVVRWKDSSPASDIQIGAMRLDFLAHGPPSPYGLPFRVTTTDDDGLFLLEGLSPSVDYRLYAYSLREPIETSTLTGVRAGQDVEIRVEHARDVGGALVGSVFDHATFAPIPVFAVRITDASQVKPDDLDAVAWNSIRDDAGRFRLDTGRRKRGFLWVSAAGHDPSRMGPIEFGPDETSVEIALEPSAQ